MIGAEFRKLAGVVYHWLACIRAPAIRPDHMRGEIGRVIVLITMLLGPSLETPGLHAQSVQLPPEHVGQRVISNIELRHFTCRSGIGKTLEHRKIAMAFEQRPPSFQFAA